MVARSSDYTPTFAGACGTTLMMSLSLIMLGNSGSPLSSKSNSMRSRLPELRPAEWSTVAANSVPHRFADRARAPRVHRRRVSFKGHLGGLPLISRHAPILVARSGSCTHRCRRGADRHQRSRLGHDPLEDGGALRLLARAVSGQSHHRWQGDSRRHPARGERPGLSGTFAHSSAVPPWQ